ncbi:MAG: cysteine desulfurase family protein [Chloroflexota bacterium]
MSSHSTVYLDYAATTPVDPRVFAAMRPFFDQDFGNPSSTHAYGQRAEAAVEQARENVARLLHCQPGEVVFTSCGSESDNLALRGAAFAARRARAADHILVAAGEHHAVAHTAEQLRDVFGFDVETLPLDGSGRVASEDVVARIRPTTALVSVMYANNEIGTVNPIAEIGAACRAHGVPFHSDAVQAAAYLPVDTQALYVDLLSLGAHKLYGPKGIGVLYVRRGTAVLPMQTGGAQEAGLRAGTQNVPYIVGMAEALRLSDEERAVRRQHVQPLRDHLIGQVLEAIPGAWLTGSPVYRLPNHASFAFEGVDGNTLLQLLDVAGFACSSGSACKSGDPKPSGVLLALGLPPALALGSLRVTLGKDTTLQDVEAFLAVLPGMVEKTRAL